MSLDSGIGNVQNPILSKNLRNSLISLDSWQHVENEQDKEIQIDALEQELANVNTELEDETSYGNNIVLDRWQLGMIIGVVVVLIAVSVFIFKRIK